MQQINVDRDDVVKTACQAFTVEFNGEHYQAVYPEPLSELSALFHRERDAWYQLINDRVQHNCGELWSIASPERCFSQIARLIEENTESDGERLHEDVLHFHKGCDRRAVIIWLSSYLGLIRVY